MQGESELVSCLGSSDPIEEAAETGHGDGFGSLLVVEEAVAFGESDKFIHGVDDCEVEEVALEVVEEPLGGVGPGGVVRSEGELDLLADSGQGISEAGAGMGGEVVQDDGDTGFSLPTQVASQQLGGGLCGMARADRGGDLAVAQALDTAEGEGAVAPVIVLTQAGVARDRKAVGQAFAEGWPPSREWIGLDTECGWTSAWRSRLCRCWAGAPRLPLAAGVAAPRA